MSSANRLGFSMHIWPLLSVYLGIIEADKVQFAPITRFYHNVKRVQDPELTHTIDYGIEYILNVLSIIRTLIE